MSLVLSLPGHGACAVRRTASRAHGEFVACGGRAGAAPRACATIAGSPDARSFLQSEELGGLSMSSVYDVK